MPAVRSGGQKRSCGAFLERGRFPSGLREKLCSPYGLGRRTGIAAQATAACGGSREPEQGRGSQRASPATRGAARCGAPAPGTGRPAGDSRRVMISPQLRLGVILCFRTGPCCEARNRAQPPVPRSAALFSLRGHLIIIPLCQTFTGILQRHGFAGAGRRCRIEETRKERSA